MDIQTIQDNFMLIIFIFIALSLTWYLGRDVLKRRKFLKTSNSEDEALNEILHTLPESDYTVLDNLYLPTDKGRSRADHIIVSKYGVFCIEQRIYYQYIRGNNDDTEWLRLYGFSKKPFTNPAWINHRHIEAIEKIVGEREDLPYFPIVAFPSLDDLKDAISDDPIVFMPDVMAEIAKHKDEVLTSEEIAAMVKLLKAVSDKEEAEVIANREKAERNKPTFF